MTMADLRQQEAEETAAQDAARRAENARIQEEGRQRSYQVRRAQLVRDLDVLKRIQDAMPALSDDLQFALHPVLHPKRWNTFRDEIEGDRIDDLKRAIRALDDEFKPKTKGGRA